MTAVPLPDLGNLPPSMLLRIDKVYLAAEHAWKGALEGAGPRPRIEDYLGDTPEPERSLVLREMLLLERRYCNRADEQPTPAEYLARFPDHADLIHAVFHAVVDPESLGGRTQAYLSRSPIANPPAAGELPACIGKYRVVARLGCGGQGEVFRAVHPDLPGRDVVIKWGRPLPDPIQQQLLAEGRTLATLEDPGLVRVYDVGVQEGRPFLVLEHVEGRSLHEKVQQPVRSPREAARLVAQVAAILERVHAHGVLHLDLKPANILIDSAGGVRLIDFGLAWRQEAYGPDLSAGPMGGTVTYMAPEQARGETDRIGRWTDVFGLGAVLYELLTGRAPYRDGEQGLRALEQAQQARVISPRQINPRVPRSLERICLKALAAAPEQRYASSAAMGAELERAARRPRMLARFAVVTMTLILLAGFVAWWRPWASPPAVVEEPLLRVVVWRGERNHRLIDAVPLRTGDEMKIHGQIPHGVQIALFWFDTEGRLHSLPLERSFAAGSEGYWYPARNQAVELTGPPGTEILLVCARRSGMVSTKEIEDLLPQGRSWPPLPPDVIVQLDQAQVRLLGPRGPGKLTDRPETEILERAETLRKGLAGRFDLVVGVAFPHLQ